MLLIIQIHKCLCCFVCVCVYSMCTHTSQHSPCCTVSVCGWSTLKGFPLAHCRGGSFQSMGGWRRGAGQGVREVWGGRDSGFQRVADLTLNHGAWSSECHRALTVAAAAKNCMLTCMRGHVAQMDICASRCLWPYFCVVCVCVCVFSRCNAAGRIYMTT